MDGLKAFKRRLLVAVLLAASLTTLLVTFVRISSAPESCRPLTGWKAEWAICIWQ